jgi:hypothetical protein
MAFPGFMILLSLTPQAGANRVVNIVLGIFHIFVLPGTQSVGESKFVCVLSMVSMRRKR